MANINISENRKVTSILHLKQWVKTFRQNISKETTDLTKYNWHIQNFPPNSRREYILSNYIQNILREKSQARSQNKLKIKIKITPSFFSGHSEMKQEINNSKTKQNNQKPPGIFTHACVIPHFFEQLHQRWNQKQD